jgi:hypothetical protein
MRRGQKKTATGVDHMAKVHRIPMGTSVVNVTKLRRLSLPTQELIHGQWWSIILQHLPLSGRDNANGRVSVRSEGAGEQGSG